MAALLAAERIAVLLHAGAYVLIAHIGLLITDAQLVECLEEADVAHDGSHDRVAAELALLGKVRAAHVHDGVAVADVTVLVHRDAAVSVAVIGESDVEPLLAHIRLQALDMRGTAAHVDVEAIGLVGDHVDIGTERGEHTRGDRRGSAVGAVDRYAEALKRARHGLDERLDVARAALDIIDRTANLLTRSERNLELTVDIGFYLLEHIRAHLVATRIDELDAVVVVGIVARRDHDATVEITVAHHVAYRRRSGHAQHIRIGTTRHEARNQRVLVHIAGTTGILANDRLGLAPLAEAVVPAHELADLECVVDRELLVGAPTEAIGTEVLHMCSL